MSNSLITALVTFNPFRSARISQTDVPFHPVMSGTLPSRTIALTTACRSLAHAHSFSISRSSSLRAAQSLQCSTSRYHRFRDINECDTRESAKPPVAHPVEHCEKRPLEERTSVTDGSIERTKRTYPRSWLKADGSRFTSFQADKRSEIGLVKSSYRRLDSVVPTTLLLAISSLDSGDTKKVSAYIKNIISVICTNSSAVLLDSHPEGW
ncbi:hypothetical protein EV421DRAFT_1739136 [Armillaria borealis]|uniref:Uncharacterized protein n=1 Tax=Armillaria borealis TaxID=47425 RepID=A0AA39MJH2_9AGAR|nr:hypothetical protein EV421DRAFT_1739136 [Armillaria borealis]